MSVNLSKQAKQLLSMEQGTIFKDPGVGLRVALIYANRYRVGMANLGFQAVYRIFNEHPEICCERVFLPEAEDEQELRRIEAPLFSLETQTPLSHFDVLAFALPFELDYPNVVRILDLACIPALSDDRLETGPLIIAGGSAVSHNPEPLSEIVDAFVIGEAEEVLPGLSQLLVDYRASGQLLRPVDDLLRPVCSMDGLYCPSSYRFEFAEGVEISDLHVSPDAPRRVRRLATTDLDANFASTVVSTRHAEFGETFLAEVSRGCPRRCRFCVTAHCVRPVRNVSLKAFLERVEKTSLPKGRVGLVGTSLSDYPHLHGLAEGLLRMNCQPSLSSLRADVFDSRLASIVAEAGQETITFAPETASKKLQKEIGKPLPVEEVDRAVRLAQEKGIRRVKLYFMIGLPGEEEEDLRATARLLEDLRTSIPSVSLSASFSILVPKPFTPFQGLGMGGEAELGAKVRLVRSLVGRIKGVSCDVGSVRESRLQGMLSLGDRRLGRAMIAAVRDGGSQSSWKRALEESSLSQDAYLAPRAEAQLNPWDVLEMPGASRGRQT